MNARLVKDIMLILLFFFLRVGRPDLFLIWQLWLESISRRPSE